ncbi:MAG: hypothetical protein CSB13_02670 [Chloroflexi bacterium]|nr:MAG: hypothetical protein CSB13_02670 [Chloroflexota bacterium]
MIVVEKQVGKSSITIQNKKRFFVILSFVVVMLLWVAGCGGQPANDEEMGEMETVAVETAVPTEIPPTPEPAAVPEIEGEIAVTSQSAVNVMAVADLADAKIEAPPTNLALVSDVYMLERAETAVTGQVAINTPAEAEVDLLDMVGWDGVSWTFIPSEYDSARQQRRSADHALFSAVALAQVAQPDPIPTTIMASTLTMSEDGELVGTLADAPADVANAYLQLTDPEGNITAVLADSEIQTGLVDAVVGAVEPYAGLNLNIQGVSTDDQEAFMVFVQNLSDALSAQGKNLALMLPAAESMDLGSYDWAALGSITDSLYLPLPLDPASYEEGAGSQLLTWATDNLDRRKLVALIPTGAVLNSDDTWTVLTDEELQLHFDDVALVVEPSAVELETAVTAEISGTVPSIQWHEDSAAYHYPVEDGEVWLASAESIAQRMETAVNHNLQGVAFTTPISLSESEQAAPAFVWTVVDEEGHIIAEESSDDTAFSWEGAAEPGEFTLQVDFVSGEAIIPLGTFPVTVAENGGEAAGIVKRNTFVHVGPGESYEKFPAPIFKDTEVEIVGRDEFGYWLQVKFSDRAGRQTGWVATSMLTLADDFDMDAIPDMTDELVSAPASAAADASANTDTSADAAPESPAPSSGPPPPVSAPPVAVGGFELGGQTHSFANPDLMASAGMNWVKFQHKWGSGSNPNDLAGRINSAHGAGFKVLLSIPGANTYPESINFEEYVQFLAGVAALGPDAIEVWNEMNIDFEWPAGEIDPASYVNNMLAPAYNAIKAANPNVMVISGAPAPTGFDNNTNAWADNRYMAGMLAAGGGNYADCIGAHYNAGASSPSSTTGHPSGSAHYSWYLLPTLNVYAQFGKPVCFTELGYLSGTDYGGVPERFSWAANTSVEQHAAWLAEAVSVAANTGNVRLIIVFNVDFTHWGDDPQAGYAMVRKNGGCPACATLANVMGR